MKTLTVWVPGHPITAGSKRAFNHAKTGKIIVTDDTGAKGKVWRTTVQAYVHQKFNGPIIAGPVSVSLAFHLVRPKDHWGTGKNLGTLKASAPEFHTKKPDIDKLARAVNDALTGIIWRDDSQVVLEMLQKKYTNATPGCEITIVQEGGPKDEEIEGFNYSLDAGGKQYPGPGSADTGGSG